MEEPGRASFPESTGVCGGGGAGQEKQEEPDAMEPEKGSVRAGPPLFSSLHLSRA